MDVEPQTVNAVVDLVLSKFAWVLQTQFGLSLARRKGAVDRVTKTMSAETDIEVRKLGVQAEFAEKKERLLQERELKRLENKLRDEDAPYVEPEVTIEWPVSDLVVADQTLKPIEHVEHKRVRNFRHVAEKTLKELLTLPPHQKVANENADPDWIARFWDNVKDVSNQDMQRIWAKLLAGEVVQPGRFSLRTLDVLRNMSSEEAKLFNHFCQFVFDAKYAINDDALLLTAGLTWDDIFHIEACGLIKIEASWKFDSECADRFLAIVAYFDKKIALEHENPKRDVTLQTFALTRAATELISIGQFSSNGAWLDHFTTTMKNAGLTVTVGEQ